MKTRKDKELKAIQEANFAAKTGELMLDKITSWNDFLEPATIDYSSLPRKNIKQGYVDVKNRLRKTLLKWCDKNLTEMTISKLAILYEEIKSKKVFTIPYLEFTEKYSPIIDIINNSYPLYR